jgi:hypothetical protein
MRDGSRESGVKFATGSQPAGRFGRFEYEHALTGASQVTGTHQPIVAGADDY